MDNFISEYNGTLKIGSETDSDKSNSRKVHVKKVTTMPTLRMLNSSVRKMELVRM